MKKIDLNMFHGIEVFDSDRHFDERGYFQKIISARVSQLFDNLDVFEICISNNLEPGIIRGLHFQMPPFEQAKLVSCIEGAIYDVFVDLRPNSKTFLSWGGLCLTSKVPKTLLIPAGFAHGYQTLQSNSKILYFLDNQRKVSEDRSIYPLDEYLGIDWPLPVSVMSNRDKNGVSLHSIVDQIV